MTYPALAGRLIRSRAAWSSAIATAAVGAVVALAFTALTVASRPLDARVVKNFGDFDAVVMALPSSGSAAGELTRDIGEQLRGAGFHPDLSTLTASVRFPLTREAPAMYSEYSDVLGAEKFGYVLTEGRWPEAPGEVVVTENLHRNGDSVGVGVTPGELSIVGEIANPYGTDSREIVAAPGTWDSWDWDEAQNNFPSLVPTVNVYLYNDVDDSAFPDDLGVLSRTEYLSRPHSFLLDLNPLLFILPAYGMAGLVAGASIGFQRVRLTRQRQLLVDLGANPLAARATSVMSGTIPPAVMAAVGVLVGWAVGVALAPVIRDIAGHHVGLIPTPWRPLTIVVPVVAIVSFLALTLMGLRSQADEVQARRQRALPRTNRLQRVLDIATMVALVVAAVALASADVATQFFFAVNAIVVLIAVASPRIVNLVVAITPARSAAAMLAMRRVGNSGTSAAVLLAFAAFAIGPVTAHTIDNASRYAQTIASETFPPRGDQVMVETPDSEVVAAVAVAIAAATSGKARQVTLSWVSGTDGAGVKADLERGGGFTAVSVVSDVEVAIGVPLTEDQAATLLGGGVLVTGGDASLTRALFIEDGQAGYEELAEVPSARLEVPLEWVNYTQGFILSDTASDLGLAVRTTETYFAPVTNAEGEAARATLGRNGMDPSLLFLPRRLEQEYATGALESMFVVLSLAIAAIGLAAAVRSQTRSLRTNSAALMSLGASPGWIVRVALLQAGASVATGLVLGFLAVLIVIARLFSARQEMVVIPWAQVAVVAGTISTAILVPILVFSRSLKADRRLVD